MTKARYIMFGGFLGAGKTTAVLEFAQSLDKAGLSVGLITNDQSYNLVDTQLLSSKGFPVEEITGGCFCCRFNSLVDASDKLSIDTRPEVFIAEPVGSCTDLRATVTEPLRKIYGEQFHIAPLSVLIDPNRALRILGLEEGRKFSSKVTYVYTKQLEEAQFLVINKADLLSPERLEKLQTALSENYPRARQFVISARNQQGLEAWFEAVLSTEQNNDPTMELDYDLYAEGEALLGWFNAMVSLEGEDLFDGNELLLKFSEDLRQSLDALEIAHMKMTLSAEELGHDLGVVNLVRHEQASELSHSLTDDLDAGQLTINIRAEGDPEVLARKVQESLEKLCKPRSIDFKIDHSEHFRPARPEPTHRLQVN